MWARPFTAPRRTSSMEWLHSLEVELTAILSIVLLVVTIPWILLTKRDSTSAVAWCLLVFFVPIFGSILFVLFGYQHIHRPLKKKRKHKQIFGLTHAALTGDMGFGSKLPSNPW